MFIWMAAALLSDGVLKKKKKDIQADTLKQTDLFS